MSPQSDTRPTTGSTTETVRRRRSDSSISSVSSSASLVSKSSNVHLRGATGHSLSISAKRVYADVYERLIPTDHPRIAFLFVNPTSGGNAAGAFTSAGVDHLHLKDPALSLTIADIREGKSGNKPAFVKLKTIVDDILYRQSMGASPTKDERIFVIMAGGDGTVLWGISELWEHQIDERFVVIGVVPFGTGNDFAKALSWASFTAINPFVDEMRALKNLCAAWVSATLIEHDLWDIAVHLKPNGSFKQIDSKTRVKKILTAPDGSPKLVLDKKICNYFSLGIESKVGIGFDRHRTTNAVRNKMVYMNEGLKKNLFHHKVYVQKLIKSMRAQQGDRTVTVFDNNDRSARRLNKCGSLIASNIPSFSSGLDMWRHARRLGLKGADISHAQDVKQLISSSQYMGDGRLEWLSFSGITSIGAEQIFEGHGKRVYQGEGPFELEFYNLDPEHRVYFQIDGEYFQMLCPDKIVVRHCRKIQCLCNDKSGVTSYARVESA